MRLPSFRTYDLSSSLPVEDLPSLIHDLIQLGNFYWKSKPVLSLDHREQEELTWEIFRGRLLDASQTRLTQVFSTWNLCLPASSTPLLSILLDQESTQLHVARAFHCHVWEAYDSGGGVILTREATRWVRELVGSISLRSNWERLALRDELMCLLFQAVVGASRLPLTSVEAPHPLFSLGQWAYAYRENSDAKPISSIASWIDEALQPELAWLEKAKLLETALRACPEPELASTALRFASRWEQIGETPQRLLVLLRTVFNEVALTPYTEFVTRTRQFLKTLVTKGWTTTEEHGDFLSYLLRQAARHLTAYDLIQYHHRGANYPDALLVDEIWQDYAAWSEAHPDLVRSKRLRRRALRQGWMIRKLCEGLPVPDAPTSPGENIRILPAPYERVPEAQILNPAQRRKTLFADASLPTPTGMLAELLQEALLDLRDPQELRELGTALFLDRPLGCFKAPAEPDLTMLFSHEAFSLSIATARLAFLEQALGPTLSANEWAQAKESLQASAAAAGIPAKSLPAWQRPGVVSLADAVRAAEDFEIVRTTRQTKREFFALLPELQPHENATRLILPAEADGKRLLELYDESLSPFTRIEILPQGYQRRAGKEYPPLSL